jgi:transcriptional regulator with XRE-family HTH domain
MKTIGAIIKEKRLKRGLSLYAMERESSIAYLNIWQWEHGRNVPSLYSCCELADFFGCSVDELCGRTSKENTESENASGE